MPSGVAVGIRRLRGDGYEENDAYAARTEPSSRIRRRREDGTRRTPRPRSRGRRGSVAVVRVPVLELTPAVRVARVVLPPDRLHLGHLREPVDNLVDRE